MTDELGREELLKVLGEVFEAKHLDLDSLFYDIPTKEFNERKRKLHGAEKQIKALIQKPGITEEWMEKKIAGINDVWAGKITEKDFIRSLVDEIGK